MEYGTHRIPHEERSYGFWDLTVTWFGSGVNTGSVAAISDYDAALTQQCFELRHVPVLKLVVLSHPHHATEFASVAKCCSLNPVAHGPSSTRLAPNEVNLEASTLPVDSSPKVDGYV